MSVATPMSGADPVRYWHCVADLDEIPRLGARTVYLAGRRVAIFRTSRDRVFALEDRCPHRGGPLSAGIVHGECVTCPLHDWVIDLASGAATGPDEGATASFPVRIEGGVVLLGLPSADLHNDSHAGSDLQADPGTDPGVRPAAAR